MFKLTRPTTKEIEERIAAARLLADDGPGFLAMPRGLRTEHFHPGFQHDHSRSVIGQGHAAFVSVKHAFKRWAQFDLGWARVANPGAAIATGQIIAVECRTLGLWTLNLSRIVKVIDAANTFGFIYSTTGLHVERGEERFWIEFDHASGDVWYEIEAVSRPRHPLARLGFPIARAFQRRFVRDSHRHMRCNTLARPSIPA